MHTQRIHPPFSIHWCQTQSVGSEKTHFRDALETVLYCLTHFLRLQLQARTSHDPSHYLLDFPLPFLPAHPLSQIFCFQLLEMTREQSPCVLRPTSRLSSDLMGTSLPYCGRCWPRWGQMSALWFPSSHPEGNIPDWFCRLTLEHREPEQCYFL